MSNLSKFVGRGSVPIDGFIPIQSTENVLERNGVWLKTGVMADAPDYPSARVTAYAMRTEDTGVAGRASYPGAQSSQIGSVRVWTTASGRVIRYDGTTWSEPTNSVIPSRLSNNGTLFLITTTSGYTAQTSPDGSSWTNVSMPIAANWGINIGITGMFMAHASGTTSYTSPTGATWTSRTLPITPATSTSSPTLGIIAAGSSATYYTSPDLITWTARTAPGAGTLTRNFSYGDGVYWCTDGSTAGTIYSSTDGINWTDRGTVPSGYGASVSTPVLQNGVWSMGSYARKSDFSGQWLREAIAHPALAAYKTGSTLICPSSATLTGVFTYTPDPAGYVGDGTNTTIAIGGQTNSYYKRVA